MHTFFFFNDTATTEIYTLSLHDALPISTEYPINGSKRTSLWAESLASASRSGEDRKSTRLNSSHGYISYAVFCLKKKKIIVFRNNVHADASAVVSDENRIDVL